MGGGVIISSSTFWHIIRKVLERVNRLFPKFKIRIPGFLTVVHDWSFWDWPCVVRQFDSIQQFFSPVISEDVRLRFRPGKVAGGQELLLGVHVRRGDYREFIGGKWFFDDETYVRAINECVDRLGCSRVILFSNEPVDYEKFRRLCKAKDIEFPCGSAVQDQWMMGQCDYLIGPPSTFTWWASFLGKGVLVANIDGSSMSHAKFRDIRAEISQMRT